MNKTSMMKRLQRGLATNLVKPTASLQKLSQRGKYSSAFDPFYTLHHQNVTREQAAAFRQVWDNDIGNFKKDLTEKERQLFQYKANETASIDEFEEMLKGLWGPDRHAYIRKTRTFEYTRDTVNKWIKSSSNGDDAALSLIMGDDTKFDAFLEASKLKSNDKDGLLNEFIYADLRYLCACIGLDHFGGPKITLVFGNRKRYHYEFPDPAKSSAYWLDCIYDRVHTFGRVYMAGIHSLKEHKCITQEYFENNLSGLKHNAMKEEEWRPFVENIICKDTRIFLDNFDRAFNEFQTDEGVSPLKVVYATDWPRFKDMTNRPGPFPTTAWTSWDGELTVEEMKKGHAVWK